MSRKSLTYGKTKRPIRPIRRGKIGKPSGTEKIVSVTTSATPILDNNEKRTEFIIQNQGSVTVYLSRSKEVATTGTRKGRTLEADEIEVVSSKETPILVKQTLYGIVAAGSCDLWVWEA